MATTVDTLLVRIEADLKDVNRKLAQFDKNVDNTTKKAGSNFRKIGTAAKVALTAVVVQQLTQAGMAAVRFASSVEEMQAKSSVVFGAFTQDVRSALSDFGDEVGRSTFELEGMASSIQDTFVPMGFARGEAAKLSVELTKLAVDVASFNNASDTDTMAAFQSALVGNHETVRRFGIVITESTLQQELYRMGVKQNAADVDNATKVQARMNLILAGTTDAHGDAARTSGSFANTSKALKAALDELLVNAVTPLLPALTNMVQGLADAAVALNDFLITVGLIEEVGLEGASSIELLADKEKLLAEQTAALTRAEQNLADAMDLANSGSSQAGHAVDGLQARVETFGKVVAKTAKEVNDLATAIVADSFSEAFVEGEAPAPAKTKGQQQAEDKVTDALTNQKFAVKQLKNELAGMPSAYLAANEAAQGLAGITGDQLQELTDLIEEEERYKAILDAREVAAKALTEAEETRKENAKEVTDTIRDLTIAQEELAARNMGVAESTIEADAVLRDLIGVEEEQEEQIRKIIEETHALEAQMAATQAANDNFAASVDRGKDFIADMVSEEEKLKAILDDVANAYGRNSAEFVAAQEIISQKIQEMDPMFAAFKDAAEKAGDAVADSLADALVEGKLSLDSFQDIFKSFIKELIAEAIKTYIIKRLLSAAFSGFAGGGSVSTGTRGGASQPSAGGGRVGGPVLVGERGPELFVPHSAGVVKNNMDTKNMLGGSTTVVNQTLNIETGVSQTVRAEITSLLPQIKQNTIAAVIDQRKRGGTLANAFGA